MGISNPGEVYAYRIAEWIAHQRAAKRLDKFDPTFSTVARRYNGGMQTTAKATHVIKWARGTLGRRAEGYSDIWWCEAKNGPTVYLGKGEEYRKAYRCQLCGQRLADDEIRHDFVVHIEKS